MNSSFHITKNAREKYQVSDFSLFSIRQLAEKMGKKAAELNGFILIHKIFHYLGLRYSSDREKDAFKDCFAFLAEKFKEQIKTFMDEFEIKDDVVEEVLYLHLKAKNPVFSPYLELIKIDMGQIPQAIFDYFKEKPGFGPLNQPFPIMLLTPQDLYPLSLRDQLIYIKDNWGYLLSFEILKELLLSLDLIEEEERIRLMGKAPLEVLNFKKDFLFGFGPDYERFSKDASWMKNVVMIAKHTYVWLYQLSKKYSQKIERLDEIPDAELDTLASYGFNAIWLIGLWERSPASSKIKHICGNPEALASPYSIYDYTIAKDLGGESSFYNLKARCFKKGIRLAGDMVPNHMGIYSKWIIEHPSWFIQLDYPPFPRYTFSGPNLSEDDRISLYIEDGYFSKTDAAVVFKRVDNRTGDVKYIYHGNDGTHIPWNDTAQLNFLNPETKEAVIQTIIHCARKFPIIRFDAAMTLTKFHYQRLWFPPPGRGGAIPSRAECGMSQEEFDKAFPCEFFREVVDRVSSVVPDTLLLAEAFWLMEGYFVRTLGIHRVYNSAFMNMLKMEENAKYRAVIKNILEYNIGILERFVNFMSNPDEETAIAQFGKDDKYFGTCVMMVTLPGLPMFSHGQIEGFSEKYGMEYKRSYWDEEPDFYLIERHKREIFPLLKKRYLFSGVEHFYLFDLWTEDGYVNENVFCYSNRYNDERALIIYNNKYETAKGFIKTSARRLENGRLVQKDLVDCLGLKKEDGYYYIFKDYASGLEYIRSGKELSDVGLYIQLSGFKYHIFLDFKEVYGTYWERLCNYLSGRPVLSIEEASFELFLSPIHTPFKEILETREFKEKNIMFLEAIRAFTKRDFDIEKIDGTFKKHISLILDLHSPYEDLLLLWNLLYQITLIDPSFIDEWQLFKVIRKMQKDLRDEFLLKILLLHSFFDLKRLLEDDIVKSYIYLNEYNGILYFHKESFEKLLNCLGATLSVLNPQKAKEYFNFVQGVIKLAEESEYQLEKMLRNLEKQYAF